MLYIASSQLQCSESGDAQVRFAVGPPVGLELRRPEFAAGAAGIDDDSVGRPEDGRGGTPIPSDLTANPKTTQLH